MSQASRRSLLKTALTAAALWKPAESLADKSPAPVPRILAMSNGAMGKADKAFTMMRFLLNLTGKPDPTICLLPTAGADNPVVITTFLETTQNVQCHPRVQRTFINSRTTPSFEKLLLSSDVIFVSGGNTLNMLAIWRAQGIDRILRQAWERGIVLAGESAGSICWFEQGSTDSRPGKVTAVDCLGFLKGSNCPHYDAELDRRPTYHRMVASGEIAPGIATDDTVGLLFEGTRLARIVSSSKTARAYSVKAVNGQAVEEPLTPECLTA